MNGLIRFSLGNRRAVTVLMLTIIALGAVALFAVPSDILPTYRSPAVQCLTFYNGMAATSVESGITARMERGTGQAAGIVKQESRSLLGVSIVRNYFSDDIDPPTALSRRSTHSRLWRFRRCRRGPCRRSSCRTIRPRRRRSVSSPSTARRRGSRSFTTRLATRSA